jgi:hypothetical protein
MAGPALACDTSGTHGTEAHVSAVSTHTAPTFDQQKAWALSFVGFWQNYIAAVAPVVANSTLFTDAQKAAYATKAAEAEQQLTSLQAAITAATTSADLKAALRAGWAGFHWPSLGLHGWSHRHGGFALFASLTKTPDAVSFAKSHPASYVSAYKSAKAYKQVTLKHHNS